MTTSWWTSTGTAALTARCDMRNTPCRHNFGNASLSWKTQAPSMDSGSVISWISPQVSLFVLPSIRPLLAERTTASKDCVSRTAFKSQSQKSCSCKKWLNDMVSCIYLEEIRYTHHKFLELFAVTDIILQFFLHWTLLFCLILFCTDYTVS